MLVWSYPSEANAVYLTFDDGPNPETTPWVLDTLRSYGAVGTFFCLGKNVEQHPETFRRIAESGCAVGNHSYSHQMGWGMKTGAYVQDVDLADTFIHSRLFRPPYSRLGRNQARVLSERYKIIMWDVLSMDYSRRISRTTCAEKVINHAHPGAIIVFHDSLRAFSNLRYALPAALDFFARQGWKTKTISY
ncbi:MAG: polysaccharide deacetylase family protein [Prevotellaceae bacterium]|nr:polysaccharide deacetylase family protein [Prevotellaceae bacterium]